MTTINYDIKWPEITNTSTIEQVNNYIIAVNSTANKTHDILFAMTDRNVSNETYNETRMSYITSYSNCLHSIDYWALKNSNQISDIKEFILKLKILYNKKTSKINFTTENDVIRSIVQTVLSKTAEEKINHDPSLVKIKNKITEYEKSKKDNHSDNNTKIKVIACCVLFALTVAAVIAAIVCTSIFAAPVLPVLAITALNISYIALGAIGIHFIAKAKIFSEDTGAALNNMGNFPSITIDANQKAIDDEIHQLLI